jgi:hypothetical protein
MDPLCIHIFPESFINIISFCDAIIAIRHCVPHLQDGVGMIMDGGMSCKKIIAPSIIVAVLLILLSCTALADTDIKILSSEIENKIARGEPVFYDGVVIEGDLNFSRLDLPTIPYWIRSESKSFSRAQRLRIINSTIIITNSKINGSMNLSGCKFLKEIDFDNTTFNGSVQFNVSYFNDSAKFGKAKFQSTASFFLVRFDQADFGRGEFLENSTFMGAQFNELANFFNTSFAKRAIFYMTEFDKAAIFDNNRFSGVADFSSSESQEIRFRKAQFLGCSTFLASQFEKATFDRATFYDYFDIDTIKFTSLDLTGIELKSKIIFASNLSLEKPQIIYVDWDSLDGHIPYNPYVYSGLIENFKKLPKKQIDAKSCHYKAEREKLREEPSIYQILYWILGFGVSLENPIALSLMIILIFSIIYKKMKASRRNEKDLSILGSIFFSFWVFFAWSVTPSYKIKESWEVAVLIEIILGRIWAGLLIIILFNLMVGKWL